MHAAVVDLNLAAQRIARLHRLYLAQQYLFAMRGHAGEGAALHHKQAFSLRRLAIGRRKRSSGGNAQIGANQALRLLLQRLPHAIGEQANGGQTAHRQHQRQQQHAPFAGTPVAAQEIEG